jgi:hypothetical protein
MISSKIREGCHYAVSEEPRKGVKEENLHKRGAHRVRVIEKGIERWAPSGKDAWGDRDGNYRNDGIRVVKISAVDGSEGLEEVLKPRDFLMPWGEYTYRRGVDAEDKARREAEVKARNEAYEEKREAAERKLRDIPGLIWVDGYTGRSQGDNIWHARKAGEEFELSPDGVEFILGRLSEMVYEILSQQSSNE